VQADADSIRRGLRSSDQHELFEGEARFVGERTVEITSGADEGAEIRDALADEELRTQLREAFEDAKAQGVTGVPTFAYGEHAARGAVPPEHLQRLVDGS
jgi:2-hydroxychromene-2-carboxylate isomerase